METELLLLTISIILYPHSLDVRETKNTLPFLKNKPKQNSTKAVPSVIESERCCTLVGHLSF